ncbi:MAG: SDR family oxidoreductase, partial [Geminicoccaceae bacterium]
LAAELGGRVAVQPADLDAAGAAERLIEAVEGGGGLDILVSYAGLTRDNLALRLKDDDWQTVLEVNLSAGFRLIRSSLRGMLKRRFGRIVSITSVVAVTGNPGQANYAAAKAGLIGMTKSLAAEVASRGITVNCVAPGMIETAMTDALSEAQRQQLLGRIPAGHLGSAADVAAAVAYLASAEASYVTGQTLHVNGGMAMV